MVALGLETEGFARVKRMRLTGNVVFREQPEVIVVA